jgi:lipopolysaccharide transport protein LptA
VNALTKLLMLVALALLTTAAVAAEEEEESANDVGIGVAPFERVGAAGAAIPDVGSHLARRLSTKGVERVVGPAELGVTAAADPDAPEVATWAERAGVDVVVVGRTTRLGESLSVHARLRAAGSGESLGPPIVVEASGPGDLGRAVDELATLVLEASHRNQTGLARAAARRSRTRRPQSSPPRAEAPALPQQAVASPPERSPFRADAPIAIKSDVLEAFDREGRKKFVFTGNVRAVQEDLHLVSDRLEAFYPPGKSQPERLVATGNVVITQTGKRALCESATYFRTEQKLVCVGDAQLDEKCDRVRGKEIVFHLDTEVLEVNGAADVRIHPDGVECEPVNAASGRTGG